MNIFQAFHPWQFGQSTPLDPCLSWWILPDTYAIWHPVLIVARSICHGDGDNVTQVLQDSGYYTPEQKEHIYNLLVPSGHQYWPGLSNVGCKCNIWLITLNGREEWFEDNRGSLVRMGQYGDGCDHFSMMQPQWIGEVGVQVDKAMKAIVSSL